jgi:hypothetical protein
VQISGYKVWTETAMDEEWKMSDWTEWVWVVFLLFDFLYVCHFFISIIIL